MDLKLWPLVAVPGIVCLGVIVYLFTLDRKLSAAERAGEEEEDL